VLNGSKHFISDGEWSDFFLVSAKTGEKEISMFMVDKGLPGFTVGKDQKMMGLRGTPHVELFFDNVPLEDAALLGEQGQGFKLAMGALNVVRLAQVGARAVGKASHVCEMIAYANDRQQFNTKIGDFQMVQQQLADSVIEINAARWMVYQAAWMLDQGLDAREQIAMVKVHAPKPWAAWSTARCRSLAAWASARSCRSSATTATRGFTGSLTAPAKSTGA
jgi:acyl-CoA dehydrogenase